MLAPRKTLWSTPVDSVLPVLLQWFHQHVHSSSLSDHSVNNDDSAATATTAATTTTTTTAAAAATATTKTPSSTAICDIGCGDGRLLLAWGTALPHVQFIGIEIEETRARNAQTACQHLPNVTIYCGNALDLISTGLLPNIDLFFLYLIPRGLRIIEPILTKLADERAPPNEAGFHIVTYMSPLPKARHIPIERANIRVPHQPGAEWPLYLYRIQSSTSTSLNEKDC